MYMSIACIAFKHPTWVWQHGSAVLLKHLKHQMDSATTWYTLLVFDATVYQVAKSNACCLHHICF